MENAHFHHCSQCDQKFEEKLSLESHVRRAHKTSQHKCIECGAAFRAEATLELHMQVHRKSF